ncbi:MAG TPA: ankyrin repeat domain-containing protein, partial [Thermoanaerobaculia bacterium]|nr:ankyrin repeat domain-containing protein [Thermoanaerobaculia bacterium]
MSRTPGRAAALVLTALLGGGALWGATAPAPLAAPAPPSPNEALLAALRLCDRGRVGQALQAGANPDAKELAGQAFPLALPCPGPEIAHLLLAKGLDPRRRNGEGYDALLLAVRAGRADVVPLLLDLGVDPNTALPPPPPEPGAPPVRPGTRNGDSALLLAVKKKDTATLRILLDAGADPNRPGEGGTTPLYTAVEQKQIETARMLLTHGADPNVTKNGKPVFVEAVSGGMDMLILLLEHEADINAVTVDPDGRGGPGETALMTAVTLHKKELVRYLIAAGADVSIRSTAGDSALDLAEAEGEKG